MAMGFIITVREAGMKVNLKMVTNMDKGLILEKMVFDSVECGIVEYCLI